VPLNLAEIASATGLTPMYFAAQFRAATGLRPHEYLLRRRIERAQEILLGSGICIVDAALSVGFQTQSHFTTVFKRFVGQSPGAWRQSQRGPEPSRAERSRQSSLNLTRGFSANGLAASSRATYPTTRHADVINQDLLAFIKG
jgi:AraC-like DNA-binding protein